MKNRPEASSRLAFWGRVAGTFALTICFAAGAKAQEQGQDQGQQQSQDQAQQGAQQQASPQPPQAQPKYPSQDADKPPYNKDRGPKNAPQSQAPQEQPQPQAQPRQTGPASQAAAPLPSTLTIPAGTILLIRTNDFLSSDRNQIGDHFTATLDQPVVIDGYVVARRGQTLVGQVKAAQKAGKVKGVSQLGLELTDLTVVDGRQMPILTELWKGSGGTSHGQDAATVAGTTGLGAIIGSAADWGRGAAIGAGVGAAVGIAAVLLTRGRPTEIPPEAPLSFRLVDPLTIDTSNSQQAFLPVTQRDYGRDEHRRPRLARAPYPYPGPYGPCGPYRPCYGYPYYYGPR
jgi:hypothetical protein